MAIPRRAAPKPLAGLYNRLAVLRADRGLTRQQLADALDINYQTVAIARLQKTRDAMGIPQRVMAWGHRRG